MPKPFTFLNWARIEQCTPKQFVLPTNENELKEFVTTAKKVRVVGSGHSWNDICLTDDTLISLDAMNRVLRLDKENQTVTVQPGIKLWQLNEYLQQHGFALRNLGSISEQSVAGAISTGTHGSGVDFQILGSQVLRIKWLRPDGTFLEMNPEKDAALFSMSVVNLGALGIITEITLKVVPAFRLHEVTVAYAFHEVVENLHELICSADHVKFWWFPHTDKMVVYRYNHTLQPANDSRFRQWLMDEVLSVYIYRFLSKVGNINTNWRVPINKLLVKTFDNPLERIETSYKVFNVPEPPLHRETEWAFDIQHAQSLLQAYYHLINNGTHRLNFIQEIRFTKADDFALSPCYGRDSMWLGVYNMDHNGWDELLNAFEKIACAYNGRPHWGKEFTVGKDYLQSVYPKWNDFKKLREQSDPEQKMVNKFVQRYFID